MNPRHHHYLSQFYLKGFTEGGSKKSKLTVIDLKLKKVFETTPRNVGGLRDFNRIDIKGLDPNSIESSFSDFEGKAANAIKQIEEDLTFSGDNKIIILNLIALYAVRSPEKREQIRQMHLQASDLLFDSILATEERWESVSKKMREDGCSIDNSITYENLKQFYKNKAYTIEVPTEQHIVSEVERMDIVLKSLANRNWLLLKSINELEPFITTDNPVGLGWNAPEKIPLPYRYSPGFGLKDTIVFFPLTRKLFLVGVFEGHDGLKIANKEYISRLNSIILGFAYKQIYTPKIEFHFMGKNEVILNGDQILK
jgi:hypothetical protein